jgi:hypothetical protein
LDAHYSGLDWEGKLNRITAKDILVLLESRHSKDVWIPECKDGPTWGSDGMVRLDGWAMKKSWSNFCSYGYEIKVSRQDFLKDDKWQAYLGLCNEFYFVCPPKIIQPTELPPEAGLLWTSAKSTMLYTKKKAPRRQVDIPLELLIYIIMCRVKIVPSTLYYGEEKDRSEYWKNWLSKKREDQGIGHAASKRLRELIREQIEKIDYENRRLKSEIDDLRDVQEFCAELGFKKINRYTARTIKNTVSDAIKGIPDELRWTIDLSIDNLAKLKKLLNKTQPENQLNG